MTDKKGTLVGRTLLKFIPENSVFHTVAEAADSTFEDILFENEDAPGTPVKELPEVKEAADGIKGLLLSLAKKGIISINFPFVEGDNEAQAELAAFLLLESYVNELTD